MNKQFLQISIAECCLFEFSQTPADGTHSIFQWWLDLNTIDKQVLLGYKIFVVQDKKEKIPGLLNRPKIYIVNILEEENVKKATYAGLNKANNFLNHLSIEYGYGFKLLIDETVVLDFSRGEQFDIKDVDLCFNKDNELQSYEVNKVRYKLSLHFIGLATKDEYIPTYFEFSNSRGNAVSLDAKNKQLIADEYFPKTTIEKKFKTGSVEDTITSLWVNAVTSKDIIQSFINLWQIIEFVKDKNDSKKLFDDEQIGIIKEALIGSGVNKDIVEKRILNLISGWPEGTFSMLTLSGMNKVLPGYVIPKNLIEVIEACRHLRGKYIHVKENYLLHPDEFYVSYKNIREIIDSIIEHLKSPSSR